MGRLPDRAAVVVPAHDEEQLLPACLDALHRAVLHAPLPVEIVVVADACTDRTGEIASAGARVLEVDAGNVGVARAAGMALAVGRSGPAGLWLLTTDADSVVPERWIRAHLTHARRGAEVVAGTVEVEDWTGWPADLAERYERRYRRTVGSGGHDHVHGANLGVQAQTYLDLGGFSPLVTGEDVSLVWNAEAAGRRVVFAVDVPVSTSSRAVTRAPEGFGAHLRHLAGR